MKKLTLLLICIGYTAFAQVNGNKKIVTRTFPIENVQKIKINFYAKVTIDQSAPEGMTITTDENLFDFIDTEVVDNTLNLDQKEWIEPSQKPIITIGAPNLRHVETGTHDVTRIINIDNDYLQLTSPVGTIILEGKTKELRLGIEIAKIDASKLVVENAFVNIWSWGNAKIYVTNTLDAEVSNGGELVYVNLPKEIKKKTKENGKIVSLAEKSIIKNPEAAWIRFKIKNNNFNRNQFLVIGPKKDGTNFSYAFPMMPNTLRKENWTVGTKVYKINSLGVRKLLVTITKEDENTIVELF